MNIYSSALKLNTQYMHTIHFNLKLRRGIDKDELMRRFQSNGRVALTNKKSSASVFSFGRDHGLFGRILNQTVIVTQSLAMRGDKEIIGTCFTPQDGNSFAQQPGGNPVVFVSRFLRAKAEPVSPTSSVRSNRFN